MSKNLSRQKVFETAIAVFLNNLRSEEEAKKTGSNTAQYNKPEWLEKTATLFVDTKLQIGTHIPKATHTDIKGGTIYAKNLPKRNEIGTHLLSDEEIIPDATGNGAYVKAVLDGWNFLHLAIVVNGKKQFLKDWLREKDLDAFAALSEIPGKGESLASSLLSFVEREEKREKEGVSDGNAKQIYWLIEGGDPKDNKAVTLLQPLYPSSLAQVVYEAVQKARWGNGDEESWENIKAGWKARREGQYWEGVLHSFPDMAKRVLGGSQPNNASRLNFLRHGERTRPPSAKCGMELFSCAPPPPWEMKGGQPPLKSSKPIMNWIMRQKKIHNNLQKMIGFFKDHLKDRSAISIQQEKRDRWFGWIVDEVLSQIAFLRLILPAGWSVDPGCNVPECERLCLDIGRVENEVTFNMPADEAFREKYREGDWRDQIADEMAAYINSAILKAGLPVDSVDFDFWARGNRKFILEVLWPNTLLSKSTAQRERDLFKYRARKS